MENNVQVVPVTQAQMTATDIDYSLKISRQVIVTRLEQRSKELLLGLEVLEEKRKAIFGTVNEDQLSYRIWASIKSTINSDGDTTRLRNLLKKYIPVSEGEPYPRMLDNNWNMVKNHVANNMAARLLRKDAMSDKDIVKIIEDGYCYIGVEYSISIGGDCYGDDAQNTANSVLCELSSFSIDRIKAVHANYAEQAVIFEKLKAVTTQMVGIDEVMKDMEAKILVRELQSSARGKEILELTNTAVSEILGSGIPMLEAK